MDLGDAPTGDVCEQMLLHMSCGLDGALAAHEQLALSVHMASCATCRARAVELGVADQLFRTVDKRPSASLASDADVVRQIMARVHLEARPLGGVLEFTRLVAQDPALHDQLRPAADMASFVALFVSAGRQHGYRFDSAEVVSLLHAGRAANDDLSDAQLDAVVGGVQHDAALHAFLNDVLQNWFKPIT
jgi:anti-sigma factor RsiW